MPTYQLIEKIIFFLFNKIDQIENKRKFKLNVNNILKNGYNKHKMINIEFISAKKNIGIKNTLSKIIYKRKLCLIKLNKNNLNKFLVSLQRKGSFPKINKIEIKPKYIIVKLKIPKIQNFINTKKSTTTVSKYFDNVFREYFKSKEYQYYLNMLVLKPIFYLISINFPVFSN